MATDGGDVTLADSAVGLDLPPLAPALMNSLRALGYTVQAALADLIDNSIAAGADEISVQFSAVPEPHVALIDNGQGMDAPTLVAAMRFGSRDPTMERTGDDLGRFGLGMKTASLSQCRRMTVISLRNGELATAEWDLDECERRGTWWLGRPGITSDLEPFANILHAQGTGTVVLWRRLDRLMSVTHFRADTALDTALSGVDHHLGFTFHRFTSGREGKALRIDINGRPVPEFDPFLEGHPRGQALHEERFGIEGHTVRVAPFVLPFPSRLSVRDQERAGGKDSIRSGHGFYVYRGRRLVVPGGWFRVVPSDELVRLARIRVDVPIGLDHLWKIDIRKTVVEPPRELRDNLRRLVGDAARRSRKVYEFRGNREQGAERKPVWLRASLRDGAVVWTIDRKHPAVLALVSEASQDFERLFRLIEDAVPFHDIYLHMAGDREVGNQETPEERAAEFEELLRRMHEAFADDSEAFRRLIQNLDGIEPFSRDADLARRIAASLME